MLQCSTPAGANRSPSVMDVDGPAGGGAASFSRPARSPGKRIAPRLLRALALPLVAVGLLAPATASAEADYQVAGPLPMAYEQLSHSAVPAPAYFMNRDWANSTAANFDNGHWVVAMPSDFTFRYWGQRYTHLSIGGNGGIKPINTGSPAKNNLNGINNRSYAIGYSNDWLRGLIAPWWTDWARGTQSPHAGGIYYEVVGEAPNRVFKIEWRNVQHFSCGTTGAFPTDTSTIINNCPNQRSYSFQVWLSEASSSGSQNSTIIFSYNTPIGPPPLNEPFGGIPTGYNYSSTLYDEGGAIGIVKPADHSSYVVPEAFVACGVNPTQTTTRYRYYGDCRVETDWPADQVVVFTNKADVIVGEVQAPATIWGGVGATMSAVVRNVGAVASAPTRVQFFGSTDRVLSEDDADLGITDMALAVPAGKEVVFHHEAELPRDIEPGTDYYIIARVDPEAVVDEDVRLNNTGVSPAIVVGALTPDLTVEQVIAPAEAPIGGSFQVTWVARNLGNLAVEDVPYVVVLSDNDVIAANDLRIHEATFSVEALDTAEITTQVELPEDLRAGAYYLGVILDPQQEVYELDEQNNVGASSQTFIATADTLAVRTVELPAAELGAPWSVQLQASGGDGTYSWSIESGALPTGLELQEITLGQQVVGTALAGVPARMGSFAFGLRVESAGLSAVQNYEMEVLPAGLSLAITSTRLPDAMVMEDYPTRLAAVGGQAPYVWTVTTGSLPQGVQLGADGTFAGRPVEDGVFAFHVQVEDAAGTVAEQEMELTVLPAPSIRCLTQTLPDRRLDEEFNFQLAASGGTAPYDWTTLESRRIPTDLDPGQTFVGQAPPGLFLSRDGTIGGTPNHAGSYVWQVEVRGANSMHPARCTLTFHVGYDRGLVIGTRTLRDAWVGVRYNVELVATGGEAPVTWELKAGTLPPGIELQKDGKLTGVIEATTLAGEAARSWDFTVVARDFRNRLSSASLRLTARAEEPVWEEPVLGEPVTEGCQSAGGTPGLLAALAVLGLAALRRRG